MKKPQIIVIDDDPKLRSMLLDSLEEQHSVVFTNYSDFRKRFRRKEIFDERPSAIFLVSNTHGEEGKRNSKRFLGAAHRIRKRYPKEFSIPIVMITDRDYGTKETAWNSGICECFLVHPEKEEIEKKMRSLHQRDNDMIRRNISLDIIGMGRYGVELAKQAKSMPWVYDIGLYSDYFFKAMTPEDKKEQVPRAIKDQIGRDNIEKVSFHPLEHLVKSQRDFTVIARGIAGASYAKTGRREDLFYGSAERINPVLDSIIESGHERPVAIVTVPMSPLLQLARLKGIPASKLTGAVPDTIRAQELVKRTIERRYNDLVKKRERQGGDPTEEEFQLHSINLENINIPVIGDHGNPIPLLDIYTLDKRKPYKNLYQRSRRKVQDFEKELREWGQKSMEELEKHGHKPYTDPPKSMMKLLEDVSKSRQTSEQPAYCYYEDDRIKGVFTSYFLSINPATLDMTPDMEEGMKKMEGVKRYARDRFITELEKHKRTADELVYDFLKKGSKK